MSFVEQGLECNHPANGVFQILNKVSAVDAEFLMLSLLSVKRRRSSGPLWEVEKNGTMSCPA